MRKGGMFIIVLFLFASQTLWAANKNVQFILRGPEEVVSGQQFTIRFVINANAKNFTPPDFSGITVLSGPNTSTSSSIQFINGRMSQAYTITFSYILLAGKPGTLHIGPATITVKRKKYKSNSLDIDILKSSSYAGTSSSNPTTGNGVSQNPKTTKLSKTDRNNLNKDVFIKASINNTHPYLGQQVVVTYRIYTKVPVSNLSINKVASFKGFWSQDLLGNNTTLKQSNETINGQQYVVATIRKVALIPQQTGKLVLAPMQLQCTVQIRIKNRTNSNDPFENFFNDSFFNQNVRNINKTLKSNPITVNVKPLPTEGKPGCFAGAVGNFKLQDSVDKTSLTTNDALTYTIKITGSGNIELIDAPMVKFPSDFETYDPKISTQTIKSNHGISGTKKFEYLAISRNPGDFEIKPVTFCYFNPSDKKYHILKTKPYKIHVIKGKGSGTQVFTGNAQEDIKFLGKDIHHIQEGPYHFVKANEYLWGSVLFYILLAIPVLLLIILLIILKNMEKRKSNVTLIKNRKATKIAKSRLQKAQKVKRMGDDKAFYDEIAQALWGYIADKFNLKQSNLSIDSVKEKLSERNVNDNTINGFIDVLNNIEFARFAPGDKKDKMENIYNEALNAILQAEKSLK